MNTRLLDALNYLIGALFFIGCVLFVIGMPLLLAQLAWLWLHGRMG